jgi:hypothetical protein
VASSARFGSTAPGKAGFSYRFQASSQIRLTDRVTGRFIGGGFNQALEEVHNKVAILMQEGQAQRLEEKIDATGRQQRPGERLKTSILHEANRDVTASGFTVGRPAWLDRSPAAVYWRRIEEGDTQTFDTIGGAFFTSTFGPGSFAVANHALKNLGSQGRGFGGAMRMPQRQALAPRILNVGPYPAYKFTLGGKAVLNRTDFGAHYSRALASRGIDMARVKK